MTDTFSIAVDGMACAGCANRLETELNAIDGIEATVNFALSTLYLSQASASQVSRVKSVLDQKGYQTETQSLSLQIEGWNCASCAGKTEEKLRQDGRVLSVEANFATSQIVITYFAGTLTPADIINDITAMGYQPKILTDRVQEQQDSLVARKADFRRQNQRRLILVIIASLLTLPLVAGMVAMFTPSGSFSVSPWTQFALATPVQFLIGWRYYLGAFRSLKNRAANMDVLVVTGTSAAYFYSLYLLITLGELSDGKLYFEASAVVITLISLGKYLEENAKQSTSSAIHELMMLRPVSANVFRAGQWLELPVDEVVLGDRVRILAGEKVPVDGVILQGVSELDESMITGESLPVFKEVQDPVIGGSINGSGVLEIRVNAVGKESSLSKIIHLVEHAQMAKAPFQQLVDKVSQIFVPVVLVIALVTFAVWLLIFNDFEQALISAVAVLVIACPCALGLATPAAVVTGTGAAARQGILIKDIDTLQKVHKVSHVILDKTGTLTQGTPKVVAIHSFGYDKSTLMTIAGSIQQQSEHPLAKAVVSYVESHGLIFSQARDVQTIVGFGMIGKVKEHHVIIGNRELMEREGVQTDIAAQALNELSQHGQTGIWLAIDHQLVGLLAVADTIRAESLDAIELLHRRNINTVMLSGDTPAAVQRIAGQLAIDDALAQVKPEDKAEYIQSLQQQKTFVAMVGDGINDAPALAQADISIAMGAGSDVAMETANITLLRNDPRLVSAAMHISKITWGKIKQNLFWAFIFNIIGIPLAAFGLLSPEIAGAAMALSSITVLSNSLLIKFWKPQFK